MYTNTQWSSPRASVLLVDKRRSRAELLRRTLKEFDFKLCAHLNDTSELFAQAAELNPDCLVISVDRLQPATLSDLAHVNLNIAQGELVSLINHSGCGKSTVLNVVAGLYQATSGGVILNDKEVNEPGPDRAVVFQNHSLLPWLTAYENVELAVKQVFAKGSAHPGSKGQSKEWIVHNLELVHMGHAMHKRPGEISGGMKQRVGIARALSMQPEILLMDEPFGALDALTRAHMQDSLMEIQQNLKTTVIMITHDVDEAVLLSDRIVMMTNGPAATIGSILEVPLQRPRDRLALSRDEEYNRLRSEVLKFPYETQRKGEKTLAPKAVTKPNAVAHHAA